MPRHREADLASGSPPPPREPDDRFLLSSALAGDEAAFRKLMSRYDRLVRYTIFRAAKDRCVRDPDWLETVAANTWTGLIRSARRSSGNLPGVLRAYLVSIARNQTISALRAGQSGGGVTASPIDEAEVELQSPDEDPGEMAVSLEALDVLKGCVAELSDEDKRLASQLHFILERKWDEAASRLGVPESTLRSRWPRVLERLRQCMERKKGRGVAPRALESDS